MPLPPSRQCRVAAIAGHLCRHTGGAAGSEAAVAGVSADSSTGAQQPPDGDDQGNVIRRQKFDTVLPRVMRQNGIDMWIYVMRPWTPDPLRFEFGASEGVFIFTDRGGERIERAAFCRATEWNSDGALQDPGAYDIVSTEGMERDADGDESLSSTLTEIDLRFVGLAEFVRERNPKRIGINTTEELSLGAFQDGRQLGPHSSPLTDGMSYKDYVLLLAALDDEHASRVCSAEYVFVDYLAGRVEAEIDLYRQWGLAAIEVLDGEFAKVKPGETTLNDLDGNVFMRLPNGRELHADSESDSEHEDEDEEGASAEPKAEHVLQGGDLFTILNGAEGRIFYADQGGNAYILRDGETEAPPEIRAIDKHGMNIRKLLQGTIKCGQTAGDILNEIIRRLEESGYHYIDRDQYDTSADPLKTQIHIDCHAVGRTGFVGPRISPNGQDWLREMRIPPWHTFTFEYMVHMPVAEWGQGKHLYLAFHDGVFCHPEKGVVFPYPPDDGIRIIAAAS